MTEFARAIDLVLLAGGVVAALAGGFSSLPRVGRRALAAAAVVLALASLADFGHFVRGHFLNLHDLYHYYFGAKYAPELGYQRLYHCTLVALDEVDPELHAKVRHVRSMESYGFVAKERTLADPDACKRHFSDLRWREFSDDLVRFRRALGGVFAPSLRDKGFNATPIWTTVAHPIASVTPLVPGLRLDALGAIDVALLALALGAVWRVFGATSACLVLVYLGGCFALSMPHVRGGFLRLDWLAAGLAAAACLERRRPVAAGALLAWAAGVRVVPLLLLAVPAARALLDLARARRIDPAARRLFASFAATSALLVALSLGGAAGPAAWSDFARKIAVHDADVSPLRVGAKAIAVWRGERSPADYVGTNGAHGYRPHFVAAKRALYERWRPLLLAGAAAAAFAAAAAIPAADLALGVALGFPVVFFAATPTFYYWVLLAIPIAVLAARLDERWARGALAVLFAAEIAIHVVRAQVRFEFLANALHATVLGVACLTVLAFIRSRARAGARAARA